MPLNANAVKGMYIYWYMSPTVLDTLEDAGFNTALIKFFGNPDTEALERRRWTKFLGHASTINKIPYFNWNDGFDGPSSYLERFSTPTRRYAVGAGPIISQLPTMACPTDERHIEHMLLNRFQRYPEVETIGIDIEFYGGPRVGSGAPGGFHNYVNSRPCRCYFSLTDHYRSVNSPSRTPLSIDPTTIAVPTSNADLQTLRNFEQLRIRELVGKHAARASYKNVSVFTIRARNTNVVGVPEADPFADALILGLQDAGKTVNVFNEQSYTIGFSISVANCVSTGGPSNTITSSNSFATAGVLQGMTVSGTGIVGSPAVYTVSGTTITLSDALSNVPAATTLTFTTLGTNDIMGLRLKDWNYNGVGGAPNIQTEAVKQATGYWCFSGLYLLGAALTGFNAGAATDHSLYNNGTTYTSEANFAAAQASYLAAFTTINA